MDDKYISGIIDNKKHELNIDRLMSFILDLKWTYFNIYHEEPKYVKIPIWIYVLLDEFRIKLMGPASSNDGVRTFIGLIVCPTSSISELKDIEVF